MTDKPKMEFDFEYQKAEAKAAVALLMELVERQKKLEKLMEYEKQSRKKADHWLVINWMLELELIKTNIANLTKQIENLKFNY